MPTIQQLTFEQSLAGKSQNERILARLKQSPGVPIPMPELARVGGCYAVHSRISDLRARGFQIEQRQERQNGKTFSFYTLME